MTLSLLSLSLTCKPIQLSVFEVLRDINLDRKTKLSSKIIKYILFQDLPHLRKLSLSSQNSNEDTNWLINRLTVFHNLKKLSYPTEGLACAPDGLVQLYQKMTWIEHLNGYFRRNEDFGALFKEHTRLTKLEIIYAPYNGKIFVPRSCCYPV